MAKKETTADGWRRFLDVCWAAKSAQQLEDFLKLYLTHEERRSISKRILLINALLGGVLTQREISDRYKVSIAKITRGSNALKIINDDLRKFLKAHLK